ncbi:hypothetical protein PLESTB_001724800 [Pleodorina starrii]|uniref:Uncharacterized protein n=2 Tax=Pleodorina starrii TaxID=330485 RepID=A0A9W6C0D2_9CHLO|nr:hypothetical protein PLESTB_001724800 [Pleodorina starrii]GLC70099.1 hypothetical protein PLESTF_000924100 [Pleodorina starrii]
MSGRGRGRGRGGRSRRPETGGDGPAALDAAVTAATAPFTQQPSGRGFDFVDAEDSEDSSDEENGDVVTSPGEPQPNAGHVVTLSHPFNLPCTYAFPPIPPLTASVGDRLVVLATSQNGWKCVGRLDPSHAACWVPPDNLSANDMVLPPTPAVEPAGVERQREIREYYEQAFEEEAAKRRKVVEAAAAEQAAIVAAKAIAVPQMAGPQMLLLQQLMQVVQQGAPPQPPQQQGAPPQPPQQQGASPQPPQQQGASPQPPQQQGAPPQPPQQQQQGAGGEQFVPGSDAAAAAAVLMNLGGGM